MSRHLIRFPILLLLASWIVDPAYLGYAGHEGALRWAALALLVAAALATRNMSFYRTRIFLLYMLFLSVLAISIAANGANTSQFVDFFRLAPLVSVVPLVLAERRINGHEMLLRDITILLGITVFASLLLGILDPRATVRGRLFGITMHPNVLALVSATFAMLPAGKVMNFALPWRLTRVAAGTVATLLTDSLLGRLILIFWVIGLVSGRLVGALTQSSVAARRAKFAILIAISLVMIALPQLLTLLGKEVMVDQFREDPASLARIQIWSAAWDTFLANPLLGAGFASDQLIYGINQTLTVFSYSHSVLMNYLATTGVLGTFSLAVMLALIIYAIAPSWLQSNDKARLSSATLALPILFATLMFASMEAGLQQMPLSWIMLWIAAGLGLRVRQSGTHEPANAPHPPEVHRNGASGIHVTDHPWSFDSLTARAIQTGGYKASPAAPTPD